MPVTEEYKASIPDAPDSLPEDIYQVQITDVTMDEALNPFNNTVSERLTWYLHVLDEGEFRGRQIMAWTANKWFVNPRTGVKSALFALAEGVFGGYGTKVDTEFGESFNPNDLIKKQVRVTVKLIDRGGGKFSSKITGWTPIKKELPAVDATPRVFKPKKV